MNIEGVRRLGEALLSSYISCAYVMMASAPINSQEVYYESYNAVIFIKGSGLELLIQHCGLEFDPWKLREAIDDYTRRKI